MLLNGLLSESFAIKQGVRQGGVLSPWVFLCYNNDILSGQSIRIYVVIYMSKIYVIYMTKYICRGNNIYMYTDNIMIVLL